MIVFLLKTSKNNKTLNQNLHELLSSISSPISLKTSNNSESRQLGYSYIMIQFLFFEQRSIHMNIQQSSKSKSNSEISHGGGTSSEIRYKKALREISKLIAMNTSLRKQVEFGHQNYQKIQLEYRQLLENYQVNTLSSNSLQNNVVTCVSRQLQYQKNEKNSTQNAKYKDRLFYVDEEVYVNFDNNTDYLKLQIKKCQQNENKLQNQIKWQKEKIQNFDSTIQQKNQLIHQLELALQKKYLQITQLQERCGDLNEKLIKSKSSSRQQLGYIGMQQLINQKNKEIEQLEKKLKISEEWNKKISNEYQQLRKKNIFNEKTNQLGINQISNRHLGNIVTLSVAQSSMQKRNNSMSRQKNRNMQSKLKKLQRQFTDKKKLKQENQSLHDRLKQMSIFIEKQQAYIENYIPDNKPRKSQQFITQPYQYH